MRCRFCISLGRLRLNDQEIIKCLKNEKLMEKFELNLNGLNHDVLPQDNGTYRIMNGEEKIGVIYAEPGDEGPQWKTLDDLDTDLVNDLGKAITDHNA